MVFDPRPCTRGDPPGLTAHRGEPTTVLSMFRSTPLYEGRRYRPDRSTRWLIDARFGARGVTPPLSFDPRPCTRGDQYPLRVPTRAFRSTPLYEGRRGKKYAEHPRRFDPRPCTRGDPQRSVRGCRRSSNVSIHAPVRGATRSADYRHGKPCFDPRPCTRGDGTVAWPCSIVSIHAPVRGATHQGQRTPTLMNRFDPRPCTRGDS